jgi:hypothetical protein
MNDLKLLSRSEEELENEINVKAISHDMEHKNEKQKLKKEYLRRLRLFWTQN